RSDGGHASCSIRLQIPQLTFAFQIDIFAQGHKAYRVIALQPLTCNVVVGTLAMLNLDLIEPVAHDVKHRINIDHIRMDVDDEQNCKEDAQRKNLLPAPQLERDKRDEIGCNIAHHLAITPGEIDDPLLLDILPA